MTKSEQHKKSVFTFSLKAAAKSTLCETSVLPHICSTQLWLILVLLEHLQTLCPQQPLTLCQTVAALHSTHFPLQ